MSHFRFEPPTGKIDPETGNMQITITGTMPEHRVCESCRIEVVGPLWVIEDNKRVCVSCALYPPHP